ncbi:lytic transglycosylase domain-containing protein [Rickettsia endosymbiont of Ceutorhynchus obstrictus]|uniref:lytic transglycosylase domain-containing protein n=1 Tax=Rickettsia endosymbiont of Ceutorhynchus obstrictus TaxID=3066249 RepID=UPI003132B7D7
MRIKFKLLIIFGILKLSIGDSYIYAKAITQDKIQETFIYLDKKDWVKAEKLTKEINNTALTKIVLSQKFLDSKYCNNNFKEVIKFLRDNPKWPQNSLLEVKAEGYLNHDTDKKIILEWFNKNPPLTGKGYKFYALAASKLVKDRKILLPIIKAAWIYGDFTDAEEKEYYVKWNKYLDVEDHVHRIDEHLWKSDIRAAQRGMPYVSVGYQASFKAQIAMINNPQSAEKLFKNVSEKYYTSGLLFRYLDAKKKESASSEDIALFKKVKNDKKHFAQWCRLQSYYAREFIDQKDFAGSYKIITIPFAKCPETVREQEWLAGWLALSFLNKPDQALLHFNKFIKIVKTPISLSRGYYWLARSYEAKGDQKTATEFYQKAAKYPCTFYGQVANIELKEHKIVLPSNPNITLAHTQKIEKNDIVKAVKLLNKYGKTSLAIIYAKAAIATVSTPAEILLITNIIKANNNLHHTVDVAKIACQYHSCILDHAFPTPYQILNSPIEAHLTYSIIRQESVFNTSAISTANAMGLMQLVKNTACDAAKSINTKCDIAKLIKDPKYNINLGSNYLKLLLQQHDNSYLLTIISYNAGPHRTKNWIERFGDPRELKNMRQVINWIELIPFAETRNYVQRVFENMQVYRSVISKSNILRLKEDLHP